MRLRIGIILVFASALPWLVIPVAVWLAPTAGTKAAWSTALLIAAEMLFWIGVLLAGHDVWTTARRAGWKRVVPELWRRLHQPPDASSSPTSSISALGRRSE
jgi:hypothetical protein